MNVGQKGQWHYLEKLERVVKHLATFFVERRVGQLEPSNCDTKCRWRIGGCEGLQRLAI